MEQPSQGADREAASAPAVLLIDLENMIGQKARLSVLVPKIEALLACVDPQTRLVAACARSRISADARLFLRERGVRLIASDDGKNAADNLLLGEAQRLAGLGVRRFIVASGDSVFAKVADLGELEVVLWTSQPPRKANAYTRRAHRVRRLERPPGLGQPPPVAAEPIPREGGLLDSKLFAQRGSAEPTPASASDARRAWLRTASSQHLRAMRRSALLGSAAFGTGVLFGAGAVVGAHVAKAVLDR